MKTRTTYKEKYRTPTAAATWICWTRWKNMNIPRPLLQKYFCIKRNEVQANSIDTILHRTPCL